MKSTPAACLCGAVRFEALGAPDWVAHCHCESCLRHTGSAFSTVAGYREGTVRWTGERPAIFASLPSPAGPPSPRGEGAGLGRNLSQEWCGGRSRKNDPIPLILNDLTELIFSRYQQKDQHYSVMRVELALDLALITLLRQRLVVSLACPAYTGRHQI